MKALDTNVLVRFLVKDEARQADVVYRVFKQAEAENRLFWVPLLVLLETIWVLESVYSISRANILDSLSELVLMPILKFEALATIQHFISRACENNCDLGDYLIASAAHLSGCDHVLTFDKKACRCDLFESIEANV